MLTAAICGHSRKPAGVCARHLCQAVCRMQDAILATTIEKNKNTYWLHRYCPVCMHLQSILYASPTCVCVSTQASGWVINERGWMASVGYDSTTERKSFLFSLWTADSELKGVLHRLLKSHLRAAVVITPITTSQHSGGGVSCVGVLTQKGR